jgi:hypothetical protein
MIMPHQTVSSVPSLLSVVARSALIPMVLLLTACPSSDDGAASTTGDETSGDATEGAGACTPGAQVACACTDGAQGQQECNDAGSGFGACLCEGGGSGSGGSTDPGTTSAAESTAGGSDSTGEDPTGTDTGDAMCTPGVAETCDCGDGPGVQRCNDAGELGPCECCMGSHPLVEGDLRYCDAGACYCGALQAVPPVDVCYDDAIAQLCCPGDIALVCY